MNSNFDENLPGSSLASDGQRSDKELVPNVVETCVSSAEPRDMSSMYFRSENRASDDGCSSTITNPANAETDLRGTDLAGNQSALDDRRTYSGYLKSSRTRRQSTAECEEMPCQFCEEGSCHKHLDPAAISRRRPDSAQSLSERRLTPLSPVLDFTAVDNDEVAEEKVPSVVCVDASPSPAIATTRVWFCNITKKEKLILLCLVLVDFTSQMCLSIMAPFFPAEAESKGVSNSMSGWIFGTFALVQVVSSPIFGKLLPIMGSRYLITAGQFFSSGCIILFGFLDYIEPEQNDVFIALCFVLRVALAIGCTAASTASFAVTAVCFPDKVSLVFGFLETATGMGMMMGPALGGLLNEVGGYMLSFAVLGGIMLMTIPVNLYCLPPDDWSYPRSQSVSLCQIFHIPAITVVCLAVIIAALIWSIMDPTLSVQLNHEFSLSSAVMGLLFLLMSCVYAMFSPIWGALADRMSDSSPMMVVGFALSGFGLLILGPSPIFNIDEGPLWLFIIALIVLGVSVSLALVPTFDKILDAIEKAGYDDDFTVYSHVAGIWGGCFAFGDFLGPAVGGWLLDTTGFPLMMTYTASICAVMVVVILVLIVYERKCQTTKRNDSDPRMTSDLTSDSTSDFGVSVTETTPLLSNSNNGGDGAIGVSSTSSIHETLLHA